MLVYQRVISAGADWSHRRGSCAIAPTAIVWIPSGTHQLRRSAIAKSQPSTCGANAVIEWHFAYNIYNADCEPMVFLE